MDRLISAERLKAHYSWWGDDPMRETFDQIVDLQPTVDPVVRCMACKWWVEEFRGCRCPNWEKPVVVPQGFVGYWGER